MNKTANVYSIIPEPEIQAKIKKATSLNEELNGLNLNHRIKLRAQKNRSGVYSFYLEMFINGKRKRHFLSLKYYNKKENQTQDKENLKKALFIRDKKETEFYENKYNYRLYNKALEMDFISYFTLIIKNRARPDKSWNHTLKHLKIFTNGKSLTFLEVDKKFCEKFRDYLKENLSANTAHTYFAKIKAALNQAIKDDIGVVKNPAQFLHISKEEVKRSFLTFDELKILKDTPCKSEQTKRAFLFGCYTGLRISDLKKLTWNEIQGEYLYFRQKKTRGIERIKLNNSALDILKSQKLLQIKEDRVFSLISDNHSGKHIQDWVITAGINKKITWHSARHTFATLAITFTSDIYTVSKLLGHTEVKNTQIYAKIIDQKKDEAIDKIPSI